ncbi:hypothetical protein [Vibrio taketomensis]|uniref:hypothetical protein n=1 Tax=Vibrio taketomensis TaxID=2572923 RepID=UPI001389B9C5|nr:hypothetical protein [Vibrio taketomensis]
MLKANRQLLIALFSAFCLLWLSATKSVQASTALPIHDAAKQRTSLPTPNAASDCPTHSEPSQVPSPIKHHAKVEHQSCSSVCVMKMPFEPMQYALQIAPSSIAPIGQDQAAKAVSRIQTLFRPPIGNALTPSLRA